MLKFLQIIILALTFVVSSFSCDRIKRKGHQALDKSKEVVKEKKDNMSDKIIAKFDASTPDTKFNKKRFLEFFGFHPTSDVKNLYCYSDQLGIDASYWFSFECNDSTAEKIVSKLKLQPDRRYIMMYDSTGKVIDSILDTGNRLSAGLNSSPIDWWDTAFIKKSIPYGKQNGNLHWYLWHDTRNKKVYFLTFDT